MRIIISPAKAMKVDNDVFQPKRLPVFIEKTEEILSYLKGLDYEELKDLWKTSHKLTQLNFQRVKRMDLYKNLTPAILSFDGLQYKYMGPTVFSYDELGYIDEHLRILSGFYGILTPFDGVVPYRLEMQAKPKNWEYENMYEFWGDKIAKELFSQSNCIINLASMEYSRVVKKYLKDNVSFINCIFGELIEGRIIQKGTLAKMARGELVQFMAREKIRDPEDIKRYKGLGYVFKSSLSDEENFVFIKENKN